MSEKTSLLVSIFQSFVKMAMQEALTSASIYKTVRERREGECLWIFPVDNAAGESDTSPVSHDASPTRCETSMKGCMFLCNPFSAHRKAQSANKTWSKQTSVAMERRFMIYFTPQIEVKPFFFFLRVKDASKQKRARDESPNGASCCIFVCSSTWSM